jgi:DNA processing protein
MKFMSWESAGSKKTNEYVQTSLFVDLSDEELDIISALRAVPDGMQLNDLALRTAKPVSRISSLLLEMEFKGLVKCFPGNLYKALK